jgi:predicted AAA+ superfamily ATPase
LISFRFEAKQSEKRLFHFTLKQNEKIGSKTKRNEKLLETKQSKNTVYLISLWLEAKNSKQKKRKEAKKIFFSREHAKRVQKGSCFASFRFKAKDFFCETAASYHRCCNSCILDSADEK